jgi:hypothetical protein
LVVAKFVLVVVVAVLLREAVAVYLLTNTSNRLEQLLFRTGAVLVALIALDTYSGIVRHPERSIFGVHPLLAGALLKSVALEQVKKSFWYVALILGIWSGVSAEWMGWIVAYVFSAWLGALGTGYAVHLGSVWASTSPVCAGVLDSIRGQNPREQAAFIYAPGLALAILGIALIFGAGATRLVIEGQTRFMLWLAGPMFMGLIGWIAALRLAKIHLLRASMIVSDIDAHWSLLDEGDDPRSVYLDWLAKDNPHRLRLLRLSWRLHRPITIGLWVLGFVAALMHSVGEVFQVHLVSGIVSVAFLLFPSRLLQHEPQWLQWSLGISDKVQLKALIEVCSLIWLSFVLPVLAMQILTVGILWPWLMAVLTTIPLCYVVSWMQLHGKQKGGLFLGVILSLVVWGTTIWIGGVQ